MKILFWRSASRSSLHTEAIIASALKARGHDVSFVLCDGIMGACIQGGGVKPYKKKCQNCYNYGKNILQSYGISHSGMSQFMSKSRSEKLRKMKGEFFHSAPILQFATNSLARHLRGASLEGRKELRDFMSSARICAEAARIASHRKKIDKLFMQRHIEYVGWGPAYYLLAKAGIPATLWGGSLDLSHKITLRNTDGLDYESLYYLSDKAWETSKPLTRQQRNQVIKFLKRGWHGKSRYDHPQMSKSELLKILQIQDGKPIWCVFPPVMWDSGLNPEVMAFKDIREWLNETLSVMVNTDDVTWVFKAHPGESQGTAYSTKRFIRDNFPEADIHVINPGSKITTNDLRSVISGGVTLQGSVGMQLPALGIPTIVGSTYYSGRGFTNDGITKTEYLDLIHNAREIAPLSEEQRKLAQRFAYIVYFRRKLPLNMTQGAQGYRPILGGKRDLLLPGKDKVMDMICKRVVKGGEFLLP